MNRGRLRKIVFMTLLIGIGYVFGIASRSTLLAARQPQYRLMSGLEYQSVDTIETSFNKMGADGWELVQVYSGMAIFRR